jgi:hypothetical protein
MKHKHYTNVLRAAYALFSYHWVSAHDATYSGLPCACGNIKRNTRLAASIRELRTAGIDITTYQEPGEQASYKTDASQDPKLETLLRLNLGL